MFTAVLFVTGENGASGRPQVRGRQTAMSTRRYPVIKSGELVNSMHESQNNDAE